MNNNTSSYTIAFYNIENLFDLENDPFTNDDDFLPTSTKRWTVKRYTNKLRKLAKVISKIGEDGIEESPAIVGLAEVENKKVLQDLIESEGLAGRSYNFVHYDSLDERGVDVAILYKSNLFEVISSETFSVELYTETGERDYTRDILLVHGKLQRNPIYIIVNHWSSRREGEKETEHKRIAAAKVVNTIVKRIKNKDASPKIIVMGDFNDNPEDISIKLLESESNLYNPFKTVHSYNKGSLNHDFQWHMFDQILFSHNFFDISSSELRFVKADVFNPRFLKQYNGKYKGQPFRTYVGKKYKGGYSDHFPVYIHLKTP
ncbi:endonuclease/exonuclease/phosphatase family protein [Winogradskyella aquimaris]|uniref:Endonuclease/exonuclease/phosphatase family protein n=1 Tax=Winogradskyella aquimaris TaxID=864074 RepID=A0ABU5EIK7_9FLAO|nr:endonuclease/exonuclease/phosphatase family protein [Winogradskyella aquimaris]MDY2586131.1 endonuclease/exonuclease/phosphatase family protein [Winogradskyella aquimaris]